MMRTAALLGLLLLPGCITAASMVNECGVRYDAIQVGRCFTWDQVRAVKVGSTEAELILAMGGKPSMVSTVGARQTWGWNYTGSPGVIRNVTFSLNNGKVTGVPNVPF